MGKDLNQCTFTGRLGADPECKSFSNGGRIANLRLAVDMSYKKKDGTKVDATEWVSVVIQNEGLIGVAERFLRKGSRILVVGEQRTRKWSDSSGNDRYSTEVVLSPFDGKLIMLDGAQGGQRSEGGSSHGGGQTGGWGGSSGGFDDDLEDSIPF